MKKNNKKDKEKKVLIIKILLAIIVVVIVIINMIIKNNKKNGDTKIYYDIGTGEIELTSEKNIVLEYGAKITWEELDEKATINGPNGKETCEQGCKLNENGTYKITVAGTTRKVTIQKPETVIKMFELEGEHTNKVTIKFDTNKVTNATVYYEDGSQQVVEDIKKDFVIEKPGTHAILVNNNNNLIFEINVAK